MIPIWEDPDPPPERSRRRWVPTCDDCGRRIWSPRALRRRFGSHLGSGCYRKRAELRRRITIRIAYSPPGDIPGQLEIQEDQ